MIVKFFIFLVTLASLASGAALEKVSVQLDWKYQFEYAGYIAAKEKGYYRDTGLDVELREYHEGSDVVSDVLSGKTNYGIYNSSIVVDNGKIKPIVVMATYLQHSPLVLIARKGIDNPADLIGKTIMGTKNELKHSSLSLLLSHFDITSQNTHFLDQTFSIDPFIAGKVNAMSAYRSNQLYFLDQMRIPYEIIDPIEYGFVMNAGNLFTSQQEAIKHSERTQKFIDATNRGWKYAAEHPGEMIDILIRKYHVKKSHEALAYEAKVITKLMMTDFYAIGETNKETTTRLYKQLLRAGAIREDQKLGQFLFQDLVESTKKSFQLTEAEKEYLLQKKKITMCVDPEWYPLEAIRDGHHIGFASDIIKTFETKLSISIELVPTSSWNESLLYAQNRQCDILSMVAKTPEREKYMDFTSTYLTIPYVLVTTMEKPFIENIDQLNGKKIGVVRGYEILNRLKKRYPNLTIVEVDSISDGLKKVENSQLYGYIDNLVVSTSYIQKEYTGSLKVSSRLEEKDELSIAVRNDEPLLYSIFQKLINQLDEATMQKIYNRWASTIEQVAWFDYGLAWKIFAMIFIGILAFTWRYFLLKRYNMKLLELSITDKLTGLYNRQKTDEKLVEEQQKVDRYSIYECSIMIVDIDYFKVVNDHYGHQIGDSVLRVLATIFRNTLRQTDVIGRWGGEEFIVILPHTPIKKADAVAENLREAVENYPFELEQAITISIGIGTLIKGQSVHETIGHIDGALYEAKKCGRNRVCCAN
ncbi:MAG: diguanylate cyclase [Sulfuricurvum sp.]|uniref:diguanylate cyclase n=1 Tax=Sulfuricurvum sp. TaxID=2025608 RepID=UPI0025F093F0|nr:diguanylate cyclase [Sulfuricurvum sp.]MBV5321267.1 diguanylate cyclase [Sulfuricurvum sp.]